MIEACRVCYQGNIEVLTLIDEFEQKYQSNETIHWYLKNSFLREMINKALRTEDTNQLYILRYFLGDLVESLAREHQQIMQSCKEKLIVYREMILSNDELDKLKEKKGQLISIKEFFIAKRARPSTIIFETKQAETITVFFEIECELDDNIIFADITQLGDILFDLNTTFRLGNIQQDDKQMWIIKMNAVKDGQIIIQKYIHDIHRQIEDLSIQIIFGKLICDMSQWDQSQKYFEHILIDLHD